LFFFFFFFFFFGQPRFRKFFQDLRGKSSSLLFPPFPFSVVVVFFWLQGDKRDSGAWNSLEGGGGGGGGGLIGFLGVLVQGGRGTASQGGKTPLSKE